MGKDKKKKTPRYKDCPTGLPSMKDIKKEEEDAEITGGPTATGKASIATIQSLIDKVSECCSSNSFAIFPIYR